jgi:hypothetical protein
MGLSSGWQAESLGGDDKLSAIERRLPCCRCEVNAANVALQHFSCDILLTLSGARAALFGGATRLAL